ncbi:MAG: hypothetical protein CMO74_14210 [Verrucomicrobiales bacterium]|nr:hypothetical protein [Verrucomicrobiales bacterium]
MLLLARSKVKNETIQYKNFKTSILDHSVLITGTQSIGGAKTFEDNAAFESDVSIDGHLTVKGDIFNLKFEAGTAPDNPNLSPWSAAAYNTNDEVTHAGKVWKASATTRADDQPGVASVAAAGQVTVAQYNLIVNNDSIALVDAASNVVNFVEGTDWTIGGTNDATATNIATAINAHAAFAATSDGANVNIAQVTAGVTGNTVITLYADASAWSKTDFTGGVGSAVSPWIDNTLHDVDQYLTQFDSNLHVGAESVSFAGQPKGTIIVDGKSFLKNDLKSEKDTFLVGKLSVNTEDQTEQVTIDGHVSISNTSALKTTTADLIWGDGTDTKVGTGAGLIVNANKDLTVGRNLSVLGSTTLDSNLLVTQQLTVNQKSYLVGDCEMSADLQVDGEVNVDSALYANDELQVSENTGLGGTLIVDGAATFKEDVTIQKNLTVKGDIFNIKFQEGASPDGLTAWSNAAPYAQGAEVKWPDDGSAKAWKASGPTLTSDEPGVASTKATTQLTVAQSNNLVEGDTIRLEDVFTTNQAIFTAVSGTNSFAIGADDTATAANLAAEINGHPYFSATSDQEHINITTVLAGEDTNYTITLTLTNAGAVTGANFSGGTGSATSPWTDNTLHNVDDYKTSLDSNLIVEGYSDLKGTLNVEGDSTLKQSLNVSGQSTFNDAVSIKADAIIGEGVTTGLSTLSVGSATATDKRVILSYDNDNNKARLNIAGDASPKGITIEDGGDIGIGVLAPRQSLDVEGYLRVGKTSDSSSIIYGGTGDALIGEYTSASNNNPPAGVYIASEDTVRGGVPLFLGGSSTTKTIFPGGSVGIGTSDPDGDLQVESDASQGTSFYLNNTSSGGALDGSNWRFCSDSNGHLDIGRVTSSFTKCLTVIPNGNIGIGASLPEENLHIKESTDEDHGIILENNTGTKRLITGTKGTAANKGLEFKSSALDQLQGNSGALVAEIPEYFSVSLEGLTYSLVTDPIPAENYVNGKPLYFRLTAGNPDYIFWNSGTNRWERTDGGTATYPGVGAQSTDNWSTSTELIGDWNTGATTGVPGLNVLYGENIASSLNAGDKIRVMGEEKSVLVSDPAAEPHLVIVGATPSDGFSTHSIEPVYKVTDRTAVTVLDSGNVGIGTSSPTAKLDINQTFSGTNLRVGGAGLGGEFQVNNAGSDIYLLGRGNGSNDNKFLLNTNGDSFLNAGDVGIGTPTPGTLLDVAGDATVKDNLVLGTRTGLNGHFKVFQNENSPTDPSDTLEILSIGHTEGATTTNNFHITQEGDVGIGTDEPVFPLTVEQSVDRNEGLRIHAAGGVDPNGLPNYDASIAYYDDEDTNTPTYVQYDGKSWRKNGSQDGDSTSNWAGDHDHSAPGTANWGPGSTQGNEGDPEWIDVTGPQDQRATLQLQKRGGTDHLQIGHSENLSASYLGLYGTSLGYIQSSGQDLAIMSSTAGKGVMIGAGDKKLVTFEGTTNSHPTTGAQAGNDVLFSADANVGINVNSVDLSPVTQDKFKLHVAGDVKISGKLFATDVFETYPVIPKIGDDHDGHTVVEPAHTYSAGDKGTLIYNDSFIYICIQDSDGTNNSLVAWKRFPISQW